MACKYCGAVNYITRSNTARNLGGYPPDRYLDHGIWKKLCFYIFTLCDNKYEKNAYTSLIFSGSVCIFFCFGPGSLFWITITERSFIWFCVTMSFSCRLHIFHIEPLLTFSPRAFILIFKIYWIFFFSIGYFLLCSLFFF